MKQLFERLIDINNIVFKDDLEIEYDDQAKRIRIWWVAPCGQYKSNELHITESDLVESDFSDAGVGNIRVWHNNLCVQYCHDLKMRNRDLQEN